MPRMSRLKAFVSVFALLPVLSLAMPAGRGGRARQSAQGQGDAASCRALTGRTIAPDMRIATAEYDESGTTVGNTQVDMPLCRIVGVAYPTADSRIGFEVWMPPISAWNGKFQARRFGRLGRRDLARPHADGAEGRLCHHVHRQWPCHRSGRAQWRQ